MGEKRIILKHHTYVAFFWFHEDGGTDQRLATHGKLTFIRRVDPCNNPQKRGLAAARMTDETDDLSRLNIERNIINGTHCSKLATNA
ncbi:hypothetical protein D9M68_889920 [compost metagenome]